MGDGACTTASNGVSVRIPLTGRVNHWQDSQDKVLLAAAKWRETQHSMLE